MSESVETKKILRWMENAAAKLRTKHGAAMVQIFVTRIHPHDPEEQEGLDNREDRREAFSNGVGSIYSRDGAIRRWLNQKEEERNIDHMNGAAEEIKAKLNAETVQIIMTRKNTQEGGPMQMRSTGAGDIFEREGSAYNWLER